MSQLNVTGASLKETAKKYHITSWTPYTCSVCDYPVKYRFQGGYPEVVHDPGCHCTEEVFRQRFENSDWDQVADFINKQTDLELIKQIIKFWHLT